ncbi:MAG TPA: pilus assembly protein MshP [Gammaproteobacteria bacterium]
MKTQRGFSLVTAIFLVTVLAVLGTFLLVLSGVAHQVPVMGLKGVQAYHAARSGLEWGIAGAINTDNVANCNGAPTISSQYTVAVTCSFTSHGGINIYVISAVATSGTPGSLGYARRELAATVSPSAP